MKQLLAALPVLSVLAVPLSLAAQEPAPAPAPTPAPPAQAATLNAPTPIANLRGVGVIAPTQNLVAQGLPPIPVTIAADVRRYTESRGATTADWHPQRRELLITTRFGNTNQLHMVRVPGGDRRQLTFFDEPVNGGSFDAAGRFVVFGLDVGGSEFTQLYRLDFADGQVTLLTDGGFSQNGGVQWNRAGDRFAYTTTRRNGFDQDIYVMNPAEPATDRLVLQSTGNGWSVTDWSPDGNQLVVLEQLSESRSQLWLVDATSGRKTQLTVLGPDSVSYSHAEFAADGRGVYIAGDRGSEFRQLLYFDLGANAFTPLTTEITADVEGFQLSPDGKRVAFKTNEGGISRIYLLQTQTRQYRALAGLPDGVVGALTWHPNNRELAFTLTTTQSPSDAYSVDVESGQLTRWTESETGGLLAAELSAPTQISWRSFDGTTISALYHKPPARFTGPRPVIINIHGAATQSRPLFMGRANYFLNELGVAIISPNIRGSTGYGKTFVKLDNGARRADAVKDIGSLLDWIRSQPDLDASRVLVTGGNGYMTLSVATDYKDRVAAVMTLGVAAEPVERGGAAVDAASITSFLTALQSNPAYRADLRRVGSGDARDSAMRAFLNNTALLSDARNLNAAGLNSAPSITASSAKPLFVVQGWNDPRVPSTESDQIVSFAKQAGGPVWYLLGKDEGHGFRKKANADFQFYAAVMFVRQYLLGEVTRTPT